MDKNSRLVKLIYECRDEIDDIRSSGDEYYFVFRWKFFSLKAAPSLKMYIYPKWNGSLGGLVELLDSGTFTDETPVVAVDWMELGDAQRKELAALYSWIQIRHSGMDTFFDDLGIV